LEVAIPRSYRGALSAQTVSGEISLGDRALSRVFLATTSGDARVGSISADSFEWRTTSGGLTADAVETASSRLASVSGDLTIKALAGDLTANSTSGEVRIDYTKSPGAISVGTVSGDVELRFPADARFRLDARSTSGDINCGFPITMTSTGGAGRHSLSGDIGQQPQNVVAVHTVSGEIKISK
jgi:lia operon protein LiaG